MHRQPNSWGRDPVPEVIFISSRRRRAAAAPIRLLALLAGVLVAVAILAVALT